MNIKKSLLSLLLLSTFVTACNTPTQNISPENKLITAQSIDANDGFPILLRTDSKPQYPQPVFSINESEVFYDMDTFKAMEDLIDKAQKSIKLDYYIFGGPTAENIAKKLIQKFKSGLKVQVILDKSLGSIPEMKAQTTPVLQMIKDAGIPVTFNNPKAILPAQGNSTIDHNKYFVIDGNEALVGSMNLAKKFYNYHDLMIHVKGPVAADLTQQFDFDWYYANNKDAVIPDVMVHSQSAGNNLPDNSVRLVGTGFARKTGFESILSLIKNAKKSIWIQMHEIGPGEVLDALNEANKRGIDVKLILDPGNVDPFIPIIHKAPKGVVNAVALDFMLKQKFNVHTYRVSEKFTTAHMKSCVIDSNVLFAGSTNWTKGGFETVDETNLEIHGGKAVNQAATMFMSDWNNQSDVSKPPSVIALTICKLYQRFF